MSSQVKDSIGNNLEVGHRVLLKLPDTTVFGTVVELSSGGVAVPGLKIGASSTGDGVTPASAKVIIEFTQFGVPGQGLPSLVRVVEPLLVTSPDTKGSTPNSAETVRKPNQA
jgi:hypothetical protein